MDSISFDSIPNGIRVPGVYIEIDPSQAVSGLANEARRLVVWGQRLSTGTVAAAVPTRITRPSDGQVYFGQGSMLARMLAALLATDAQYSDIWAIALNDHDSGVKATQTITVTGPATASGTLALYVVGVRLPVTITATDTAPTIATAIAAAITANADLPVTAAVGTGGNTHIVTLTARNAGTCGNDIDVRHSYYMGEALPAGVGVTIAAGTAGATNPLASAALAAMTWNGTTWVINPWTDDTNLAAIEAEQITRWGPLQQIPLYTACAVRNTFSGLGVFGSARNGFCSTTLGINASPTWTPEIAAAWGGVCHYQLMIDPARPLQTLQIPGVMAPAESARFTWSEANLLAYDGISVLDWGSDGTGRILTSLTNYQQTPSGVETTAFLKINTPVTVHEIRYQVRRCIAEEFPRSKLVDDDVPIPVGNQGVTVSPRIIKGRLVALGEDLVQVGLVEHMGPADIVVVRSESDRNRVNAVLRPDIVNQFDVFAAKIQFLL